MSRECGYSGSVPDDVLYRGLLRDQEALVLQLSHLQAHELLGCHQCCAGHNNMQVILIILRIKRISPITFAVQLVQCHLLIPIGIILYK